MKEARSESVGDQPVRVTVFVRGQGQGVGFTQRAGARRRGGPGAAWGVLETLGIRRPFPQPVPAGSEWWVQGLLEIFDVAPGAAG